MLHVQGVPELPQTQVSQAKPVRETTVVSMLCYRYKVAMQMSDEAFSFSIKFNQF